MSKSSSLVKPSEAFSQQREQAQILAEILGAGGLQERQFTYHAVIYGQLKLLLPQMVTAEVIDELDVCELPASSELLLGVSSVRGQIVPVFDLFAAIGFAAEKTNRFVVASDGDLQVGFNVSQLPQKVVFSESDKVETPVLIPESVKDFCGKSYRRDGVWIEWDLFGFFQKLGRSIA